MNLLQHKIVRVAACSPEIKVGDVEFNAESIIKSIKKCSINGAHFALFPELCLTGYTCGDLFFNNSLQNSVKKALMKICDATKNIVVIVGAPLGSASRLYNCAVVIANGVMLGAVPKSYLPNSREFYEKRWFASEYHRKSDFLEIEGEAVLFGADLLFQANNFSDLMFGVEICEDLWSVIPPSSYQAISGANLFFNLSASNETLGKYNYRKDLVAGQSARCLGAYCYASSNACESSTDLLFSGHTIIAENGQILAEGERFEFDSKEIFADIDIEKLNNERKRNSAYIGAKSEKTFRILDFDIIEGLGSKLIMKPSQTPFVPENTANRAERCKEIISIQTAALAKRIKHINLKNIVIGVSGGLDSTLALIVAYMAFKKLGLDISGIKAISMPGFGTSDRTKNNAKKLIELLGADYREISIVEAVKQHFKDIGQSETEFNIVYENAQARERTQILMDVANQANAIVLGTGDLSELALGWCTYNADHMSMYGVNSGVAKTLVKYLVLWCAEEGFSGEITDVLIDICNTPISPELLPLDANNSIAQKTEDSVGPYILNDFFIYYFVRNNFNMQKILFYAKEAFEGVYKEDYIKERLIEFIKRFFSQQFKRSCLPDGVKIGSVDFSPRGDWRMPSDAEMSLWIKELTAVN